MGLERYRNFRSARDQDHLGRRSADVRQDVRALRKAGRVGEFLTIDHRKLLASEHETHGAFRVRQRHAPGLDCLRGVARPHHRHVRHGSQTGQLLDGLMRRAILAERDAVMGPDVDDAGSAQCRQADAWPHVVGERQERRAKGEQPAMNGDPGQDRGHRVLPQPEMNVSSRVSPDAAGYALCRPRGAAHGGVRVLEITASFQRRSRRRVEIRGPTNEVSHDGRQRVDRLSSCVARCHLAVRRREDREVRLPSVGQFTRERASKWVGHLGMRDAVRVNAALPRGLQFRTAPDRLSERAKDVNWHVERAVLGPSQRALRQAHLFDAERLAVRVPRVLLVRAAVADMRAGHDQRRPILFGARDGQRCVHSGYILTIDPLYVPAIGFEARADILRECHVRGCGEREQVGVVQHDQATELQRAGE